MAIRAKTKQRLILFVLIVAGLVLLVAVGVGIQTVRLDRRAKANLVLGKEAFDRKDYPEALDKVGRYLIHRQSRLGGLMPAPAPEVDVDAWYRYAASERRVEQPNGKHL